MRSFDLRVSPIEGCGGFYQLAPSVPLTGLSRTSVFWFYTVYNNSRECQADAGLAQAAPAWKKPALSPAEGPVLGRVQGRQVTQHRLFHGGAAHRET
jgi:hypothetical protein